MVLLLAILAAEVSFNRDIRPIMSDTCFRCHGPDKNARMAGMRLDLRDEALKKTATGAVPIVPGDPDNSAIVQRIFATDARLMPPKFAHKELTATQKDTIRRWVAEGAKYEGHWAYLPVRRPPVPAGAKHPVDAFVQERLAREGLTPSPEADRRTLIRRVSLDLT
ncbi:MAG: c-type cytochrome domain-containing protein, partial [Bryobacteraceae bacterium]